MTEEVFDIFDPEMIRIGTAPRSEVHAKGLWHQTFHCWIWSRGADGKYLLFQLRHRDKDTFPGLLDISCAGHLQTGETPEDGIRELEEELGVMAAFSELTPCGIYREEDVISERLIDREFCHVYVLEKDVPLTAYRMQPEEVVGLFQVRLDDLKRLLAEGGTLTAEGVLLNEDGSVTLESRTIAGADLVPHPPEYFALVFQALEQA